MNTSFKAEVASGILVRFLKVIRHDPPVFRAVERDRFVSPKWLLDDVREHTFYIRIDERTFWPALWASAILEVSQACFALLSLGCEFGWPSSFCNMKGDGPNTFVVLFMIFAFAEPFFRLYDIIWITILRNIRDGDQVLMHRRAFDRKFLNYRWIPVDTMYRPGPEMRQLWNIWPPDVPLTVLRPRTEPVQFGKSEKDFKVRALHSKDVPLILPEDEAEALDKIVLQRKENHAMSGVVTFLALGKRKDLWPPGTWTLLGKYLWSTRSDAAWKRINK